MKWNVDAFRNDFPALQNGELYFDSGATALKPMAMVAAVNDYYQLHTANAARSPYRDAEMVTAQIQLTRAQVAKLVGASNAAEIVWTKGATESANLIADSYAGSILTAKDEIIVSEMEHHSNLLPWLRIAELTGAKVVKWPLNAAHQLEEVTLSTLLTPHTRIVAITQMSNVTGYQPDLAAIIPLVHNASAVVVVDGAQGIAHYPINVQELDIDFYFFSAHKLYGPTGLGVLYAKAPLFKRMPVWQAGGKMLKKASFTGFIADDPPAKFEAGTLNISSILGFKATLDWLKGWDQPAAEKYSVDLATEAERQLRVIDGFKSYRATNSPILSFTITGIHYSDLALLLASNNIAIRAGNQCASPLMAALAVQGVIRACFTPFIRESDMKILVKNIKDAASLLRH